MLKLCGSIRRQTGRLEARSCFRRDAEGPADDDPPAARSRFRAAPAPTRSDPPCTAPRVPAAAPEFAPPEPEQRPPHRRGLLSGLKARVADGVFRRRAALRPGARLAGKSIAAISASWWADVLLIFLVRRSQSRAWPLAKFGFWVVRSALTLEIAADLAALRTQDALSAARMLNLLFRSRIRARERPDANLYFETLYRAGLIERIVREVPKRERIADHHLNYIIARSHLYHVDSDLAEFFVRRAVEIDPLSSASHRLLGRVHLAHGDLAAAAQAFAVSVRLKPSSVMAHQNYAARYDRDAYKPRDWELKSAGELLIYDNLGEMAEDLSHRGRIAPAYRCYERMLAYQAKLGSERDLPQRLRADLAARYPLFDAAKPARFCRTNG